MRKKKKASALLTNLMLLVLIAGLYAATSAPQTVNVFAPVYRGQAQDKAALLCAVDWSAAALPDILDVLEAEDVKITFALSGAWARENPALLMRLASGGQEIAVMGDDPALDGRLSAMVEDVQKAAGSVKELCGVSPWLYYSGGRSLATSSRTARKLSLTHVLCTADLLCARGGAEDILERAKGSLIPGGILLITPTRAAAEALPGLLTLLENNGLAPSAVGGVLERKDTQ